MKKTIFGALCAIAIACCTSCGTQSFTIYSSQVKSVTEHRDSNGFTDHYSMTFVANGKAYDAPISRGTYDQLMSGRISDQKLIFEYCAGCTQSYIMRIDHSANIETNIRIN